VVWKRHEYYLGATMGRFIDIFQNKIDFIDLHLKPQPFRWEFIMPVGRINNPFSSR